MAQQQRNQTFSQPKAEHLNGGSEPVEHKAPVALPFAIQISRADKLYALCASSNGGEGQNAKEKS
jgi:hypothetical protein